MNRYRNANSYSFIHINMVAATNSSGIHPFFSRSLANVFPDIDFKLLSPRPYLFLLFLCLSCLRIDSLQQPHKYCSNAHQMSLFGSHPGIEGTLAQYPNRKFRPAKNEVNSNRARVRIKPFVNCYFILLF